MTIDNIFTQFRMNILIIFLLIAFTAEGQSEPESEFELTPLDSSIRYGRLDNGFTYFIKSVPAPQSKLFLRFYNAAGYSQEEEGHPGTAHLVEHLIFKGTEEFPEGIHLSPRTKELGMDIFDMLAFNSKIVTSYYFDAPANNPEALDVGLDYFEEIANGAKLAEEDILSVAGEVRQENTEGNEDIERLGADSRFNSKFFPCATDKSDLLEYLENIDPEVIRRFYRDWYRPDRLAIVVVGDIGDIDALEQQIIQRFSDLEMPENPKKISNCDSLFYSRPPQYHVVERKAFFSELMPDEEFDFKMIFRDRKTHRSKGSLEGLKRRILKELLNGALSRRMAQLEAQYGSYEILLRNSYRNELPPSTEIGVRTGGNEVKTAVLKVLQLILQLRQYGVLKSEWKEIKENQLQNLSYNNVENPEYWIHEIVGYYSRGEALPSDKQQYLMSWLSDLDRTSFNDFVKQYFLNPPEDIGIIAPTGHSALSLTEDEVRLWIENAFNEPVEPYEPPKVPMNLMTAEEIAALSHGEPIMESPGPTGGKEFLLRNGLKLVIKSVEPTAGAYKDKIMIHGYSERGAKCFPKGQFYSAVNAPNIVAFSGVGGMDRLEIDRFLSSKDMLRGVVSPYIGYHETGVQAVAIHENLESVLQLMYLYFTSPNRNPVAFKDWKRKEFEHLSDPFYSRYDYEVKSVIGDPSVLTSFRGKKMLRHSSDYSKVMEETKLDRALEIYEALFGNASDFTFVVTGNFDIQKVKPILLKYLGSLPNKPSSVEFTSAVITEENSPEGPRYYEFAPPQYFTFKNVGYGSIFLEEAVNPDDWQEQIKVKALAKITKFKNFALRFEKGYSLYGVHGEGDYNENTNRYELNFYFECVPKEYLEIRREFHKIISSLISEPVSQGFFEQIMKDLYEDYEVEGKGGEHWKIHQDLYEHYRYGQPIIDAAEVESYLRSLTRWDILETAKKYYKPKNFYEFSMMSSTPVFR